MADIGPFAPHDMTRGIRLPQPWLKVAAFLAGCFVFMPVGVNYLGAVLMLLALAASGAWPARVARLRAEPLRWGLAALVGWSLVVLLLRPHHDETWLSVWHLLRIAVTLALTLLLSADEAAWALRGFAVALGLALLAILLTHTAGLPDFVLWHNVTVMKGNKSINDALLFALAGASSATWALSRFDHARPPWRSVVPALVFTLLAAGIVTFVLPSRTSLLALLAAVGAAIVHQWRGRLRALAVALLVGAACAGALVWQAPSVQQKFALGLQELEAAQAGTVSEGSWVVRFYMYRETTRMMLDRPLAGWGLGSWTPEWHRRGPPLLRDYSMPHNDFLWLGAEQGVPGLLALAAILLTALVVAWRRRDLTGRLAFAAMWVLLVATCLNSAWRDAAIGLSLPWIAFVYLRLAQAPGVTWARVLRRS